MEKSELMLYSCIKNEIKRLCEEKAIYIRAEDKKQVEQTEKNIDILECRKEKIERFIQEIEDPIVRKIFRYRYLKTERRVRSWYSVANKIGGGNTADGVRKMHDRYLKKC